jgi:hypothetical protein
MNHTKPDFTEVKKKLYKEKPTAYRTFQDSNRQAYVAELSDGEVVFDIPISDAIGANLQDTMPSQLLIRWIKEYHPVN